MASAFQLAHFWKKQFVIAVDRFSVPVSAITNCCFQKTTFGHCKQLGYEIVTAPAVCAVVAVVTSYSYGKSTHHPKI